MVTNSAVLTAKVGEEKSVQQQAETITGSSLQQQLNTKIRFLEYQSMRTMIGYLRHHNPECWNTIVAYGYTLKTISNLLSRTPDEMIADAKTMSEDDLMKLFLQVDKQWIDDICSPKTRVQRWAILKTFLYSNGVYKAKLLAPNIQTNAKFQDYALNKEDCRKILNSCRNTIDKLTVSLLIESLQRIGTISSLTWGDITKHLDKGEEVFLIWIDARRTKRSISHWMPVGKLSTYYMRKRREELAAKGIEIHDDMPLITPTKFLRPVKPHSLATHIYQLMIQLGVKGKREQIGVGIRYEKRVHSFRKFGVVEMQRAKVNEEIIRFLMGQSRDTYSNWLDKYDELLEAYREAMPHLEPKNTLQEVVDFAKSRGFDLDPKAIIRAREIRVDPEHSRGSQAEPGEESLIRKLY